MRKQGTSDLVRWRHCSAAADMLCATVWLWRRMATTTTTAAKKIRFHACDVIISRKRWRALGDRSVTTKFESMKNLHRVFDVAIEESLGHLGSYQLPCIDVDCSSVNEADWRFIYNYSKHYVVWYCRRWSVTYSSAAIQQSWTVKSRIQPCPCCHALHDYKCWLNALGVWKWQELSGESRIGFQLWMFHAESRMFMKLQRRDIIM